MIRSFVSLSVRDLDYEQTCFPVNLFHRKTIRLQQNTQQRSTAGLNNR